MYSNLSRKAINSLTKNSLTSLPSFYQVSLRSFFLLNRFNSSKNFKPSFIKNKLNIIPNSPFTQQTIQVTLNETEAYALNEHDKIIVQIDNNTIPLTSLPKTMKDLMGYSYTLSQYKEHINGWGYIIQFFEQNIKNFTNEDLDFYSDIFAKVNLVGEGNFWDIIVNEYSSRSLDKKRLLDLLKNLSFVNYKNQEMLSNLINQSLEQNLNYVDYLSLAASIGEIYMGNNDSSVWETIISNLEGREMKTDDLAGQLPPTVFLSAALMLKDKRESDITTHAVNFYNSNFNLISSEYQGAATSMYMNLINNQELMSSGGRLIAQTLNSIAGASEIAKFTFYVQVLRLIGNNTGLLAQLNNESLPSFFVVPSAEYARDFVEFENRLATMGNMKSDSVVEMNNSFWIRHSEKVGFNIAFAQSAYLDGYSNVNALNNLGDAKH